MYRISSSFRDPSGRVYEDNGKIFRTIADEYKPHFEALIASGLYDALVGEGLIVPHVETGKTSNEYWKLISPQKIDFISYPFEWSFTQLKDAALLTLRIMKLSLERGMCLKDASAFNVQLHHGKPIFIDTLSFEKRERGVPWMAYGQFCRHFLAPLLLMVYTDTRMQNMFIHYLDGIPLDLASKLLPMRSWFKPGIILHMHTHAKMVVKSAGNAVNATQQAENRKTSVDTTPALIDSLTHLIQSIKSPVQKTEWGDYYSDTNYSAKAFASKKEIVDRYVAAINPKTACDLGANDGTFSRIAGKYANIVISADIDPVAVEKNYRQLRQEEVGNIIPVLIDLTNPTPGLGWANSEWMRFGDRCRADVVLALGLLHHLCISNNLPLDFVADYLAELSDYAIVEFIPKSDSNVQRLLASRRDIFPQYTQAGFETAFHKCFEILDSDRIADSQRRLYYMKKRT